MNALPVSQPPEATSNDHADCARLEAQAITQIQQPGTLFTNIPDGATADQIRDALAAAGFSATVSTQDMASLQTTVYHPDVYLIAGVNCTPDAVPVPQDTGIRHWLAAYAPNQVYNCWHSTYDVVDLNACHHPQMGTVIVALNLPTPPTEISPMNGKRYTEPNGTKHVAFIDGNQTLWDGRLSATGWVYGRVIAPVKVGGFIDAENDGVGNIWCLGTQGDLVHMAFVNGHWTRQSS